MKNIMLIFIILCTSLNIWALEPELPEIVPIELPKNSPELVIESPSKKRQDSNVNEEKFKQNRGQEHLKTYDNWKNGPAHPNDGNVP